MFQHKLFESSCRSCFALCNYSPIWVLLPILFWQTLAAWLCSEDCVSLRTLQKSSTRNFIVPRSTESDEFISQTSPVGIEIENFCWKILIKDKSLMVTSITNRRTKQKHTSTHRLSSRLSTNTKKLERSSSRSRTRLRASTDVWKSLWRQSMVTMFPFEMTYRRWVALLIDLGTLLSPKLLICDAWSR